MIAITQRPEVLDPARHLSRSQCDCLATIAFYKHNRAAGPYWQVGKKRFSKATVIRLARLGLITRSDTGMRLTLAGDLALSRLRKLPAAQTEQLIDQLDTAIDRLSAEAAHWAAAAETS